MYVHKYRLLFANSDGPHDAVSCPIDHIAMHTVTELDVECIHQATAFVNIDSTLLHRPAFSTYLQSEAQRLLVRFVVDMFYKKITTKPQQIKPVKSEP